MLAGVSNIFGSFVLLSEFLATKTAFIDGVFLAEFLFEFSEDVESIFLGVFFVSVVDFSQFIGPFSLLISGLLY